MRQRPLAAVVAAARAELRVNPTITVYSFRDGREHHRRPANTLLRVIGGFSDVASRMRRLNDSIVTMNEAFRPFAEGGRVASSTGD